MFSNAMHKGLILPVAALLGWMPATAGAADAALERPQWRWGGPEGNPLLGRRHGYRSPRYKPGGRGEDQTEFFVSTVTYETGSMRDEIVFPAPTLGGGYHMSAAQRAVRKRLFRVESGAEWARARTPIRR